MKKFLSSILAVAVILTSFSMVAFAAGTTELYFNDGSTVYNATENTFELTLKFKSTDEDNLLYYGFDIANMEYSFTNASVEGTVLVEESFNTADANATNLIMQQPVADADGYNIYTPSAAEDWAKYTVTRSGDAETTVMTITTYNIEDSAEGPYTISCPSTITINWPKDEPVGPTTVEKDADIDETVINAGDKDWTWDDAKSYLISAEAVADATEIVCKIDATYDKGEETNKTKTIFNESVKGIVIKGESTVSFRTVLLNTDEITNLRLDGTFIFTK